MSLFGEDRFVYIHLVFFVRMICLIQSKCMYFWISIPPFFSKLSFISKILNFTMQINAYQEGMKVNIEVNEQRRILHISTHWNKRHRWFQRVPVSFSLAAFFFKFSICFCVLLCMHPRDYVLAGTKAFPTGLPVASSCCAVLEWIHFFQASATNRCLHL